MRKLIGYMFSLALLLVIGASFILTGCFLKGEKGDTATDTLFVFDTLASDTLLGYGKLKYVGSDKCESCHEDEYAAWKESGHPRHIWETGGTTPVLPDFHPGIKKPQGTAWSDIQFIVGGWAWKARFLDADGYFITAGGNNEYRLASDRFVDYHADEAERGYSCAECHTTGYDPDGVNDLPGFEGTWAEMGVTCERCHGAASYHIDSKGLIPMKVNPSSSLCRQCHERGDGKEIRAEVEDDAVFIGSHHAEANEMNNSKHAALECQVCHNAHASAHYDEDAEGVGIKQQCEDCHSREAATFAEGSPHMSEAGVKCVDCHMPKATVVAEPVNQWVGDRHTHLFKINTDPDAPQTSQVIDGADTSTVANPYIGLGFACLSCHGDSNVTDMEISEDKTGKDIAWAGKFAKSVHRASNEVPNYYAGYEVCAICHENVFEEWAATDHGHDFRNDSTNTHPGTEAGRDFIHNAGCIPCHVVGYTDPTGWNDIANRVDATLEDSLRLEGIQCESCHGPSGQHAEDGLVKYSLTDVDYQESCIRCHVSSFEQLSGHVGPADSAGVEGHASGLHHPQSLLFYGADLYEYPGKTYSHSAHKNEVVQGCRTCHMFPETGHDLMPDEEACKDCHKDFEKTASASISNLVSGHTLEFSYQGKQDTIDFLYFTLDSLLGEAVGAAADSADSAMVMAYFPYKAANYNLRSIAADKSFGIHDYKYISQILKDGIADTARYLNLPQKMAEQSLADSLAQVYEDSLQQVADSLSKAIEDSIRTAEIKRLLDSALADTLP